MTTTTKRALDADIAEALNSGGEMTRDQVLRYAMWEAELLGLEFDEAIRLAHEHKLPKTGLGTDLLWLIQMLDL